MNEQVSFEYRLNTSAFWKKREGALIAFLHLAFKRGRETFLSSLLFSSHMPSSNILSLSLSLIQHASEGPVHHV